MPLTPSTPRVWLAGIYVSLFPQYWTKGNTDVGEKEEGEYFELLCVSLCIYIYLYIPNSTPHSPKQHTSLSHQYLLNNAKKNEKGGGSVSICYCCVYIFDYMPHMFTNHSFSPNLYQQQPSTKKRRRSRDSAVSCCHYSHQILTHIQIHSLTYSPSDE
mgnify:CR=1 FL=1